MENKQCAFCPGCKKHCSACKPRCGYGRKYFSACRRKQKQYKWEKYTERGGLVWQLLDTGKHLKKALKQQEISEEAILCAFTQQDQQLLSALLSQLKKQLDFCK